MKSTISIPVPPRFKRGDEVTASWANQIRDCLHRLMSRNDPEGNQPFFQKPPPFWPSLYYDGTDYKVSLERGVVISPLTTASGTENFLYTEPSNILTGGYPTKFTITDGDALYLTVRMSASAVVSTCDLGVFPAGSPPSGTDSGSDTAYSFKMCYLDGTTLTRFKCGDNIDLCGRNLDLRVYLVHSAAGVLSNVSNHYLCWRFGDYVGKFSTTPPPVIGTVDTDSVTYFTFAT